MKKNILNNIALITLITIASCSQEKINLQVIEVKQSPDCPADASKGNADFTKFVALGSSYTAGVQGGALFTSGQSNSLAAILANKFQCPGVDGPATFNQPDIGSDNGYNVQLSIPGVITLGRLVLFDPDGPAGPRDPLPTPAGFPGSAVTCPTSVTTPALPAPYNTADLPGPYAGDKATLNNFGVPYIYLGQALTALTGGPSSGNPYYSPYYARFATSPGTSTLLGDALGAAGSFYLIQLGLDDVLFYAVSGADGSYPLTDAPTFGGYYHSLITTMLGANPVFKGVVCNIPNITSLPYFYTVPWNTIELDADQAAALTANLANNYNAFLDGMVQYQVITSDEATQRKLTYVDGYNGVLMTDEDLTDLSQYMVGPYAGLLPYAQARQATKNDLVPLSAGSILGTCNGSDQVLWGVSYPVGDTYMLTTNEIVTIMTATAAFNTSIATEVAASGDRLVVADLNQGYADFVAAQAMVSDGVTITPNIAPPTAAFSEDGLHPNARGYAFTANIIIDAINTKFAAKIPHAKLNGYMSTGLPVNP